MALVKIELGADGLVASLNGDRILVANAMTADEKRNVKVWSSSVKGDFYPREVDEWFSSALGVSCRLVSMPETTRRKVNPFYAVRKFKDTVSFADGYPFLLIGEGSLADLNSKLEDPVPMNRFRPNFVVTGSGPFEEDTWKRIRIGSTEFHVVKPSARCVITTVDQATGLKNGTEPLKTLSSYRNRNGNVLFGQNLIAETAGATVRVGDAVEAVERSKTPLLV
jgi:uncharacterized protein YcbX